MRLVMVYRPNSEYARICEEFVRDYGNQHPNSQIEVLSLDTREGSTVVELYDIVDYPAILALQNDGSVQKIWQGKQLPTMDEVASYTLN